METLDIELFQLIYNLSHSLAFLNPIAIFFAEYAVFLLAFLMVILWFVKPQLRKTLLIAFISFVIAEILVKIVGVFISHPQPFVSLTNVIPLIDKEAGNSFPSDHAALAFSVCIALFIGSRTKSKFLYLILAFLISIARIWVGVHYPSDVIVAAILGTCVALLVHAVASRTTIIDKILDFYTTIETKIFGKKGKHTKRQR